MLLNIEFDSDVPIYLQIKNKIILEIAKGNLKNGDSLPSVRQMAGDLEINLHTINKAYNLLKTEGYLQIDRRSGTFISVTKSNNFEFDLKNDLELIIAKAKVKGYTENEISNIVHQIYKNF
ncbi:MAG: GntR family transcriptional regulator [Sarcina sp.]